MLMQEKMIWMYYRSFKNDNRHEDIDHLPIIMDSYINNYGLKSTSGSRTLFPLAYSKNIDLFKSIFDGAALGQYLGGIDPIHSNSKPGFINETCLFNPSHLTFEWKKDQFGQKFPT